MKSRLRRALALTFAATFLPATAFAFDRVQPAELKMGRRAGLAGALASTAYGPSDVSRGGFSLPGPFSAPRDRGPLLVEVFPSYSPDNGMTAWGMGFASNLELTRWRASGSLQFDFAKGDELTSPFGRLTRGTDGHFYPVGVDKPVRVTAGPNDTFIAYHPDGSTWRFGGNARLVSPKGTYSWRLTEVRDAVGHVTTLTWAANASGNLFLAQVDYGGRTTTQYRIQMAYEPVTVVDGSGNVRPKFVDYRSGTAIGLDQRVKTVFVLARNAETGAYAERCRYTLGYVEEDIGAAFYLARVDQTFASGESAPPVRYTYNLKGTQFPTSHLEEVPQLTELFTRLGVTADMVQPTRAAVIDADSDGNPDLELATNARTLVAQKGSGTPDDPLHFDVTTPAPSSLPACTQDGQLGCVFQGCLPTASEGSIPPVRMLSQLNPTDTAVHVVHFAYNADTNKTAISVCARDGARTSHQRVPSLWDASSQVRFVDLNGDHLPDLVRFGYGRFDVLPNASEVAGAQAQFHWGSAISGTLADSHGNPFTPDDVWVSDASGDGNPDLVAQWGDSLWVWHGLGNFQFAQNAQEFRFYDRHGDRFGYFLDYRFIPSDLNKDGLQDYFVTNDDSSSSSRFVKYFTNVGGRYVEVPIAALDDLPYSASTPVIATLDGSGNLAVTVTDLGRAFSIPLEGPETGLMQSVDDGKGTVLSFEYARGPASPGVRQRYALLSSMRATSSGYDAIQYDYRYLRATLHSTGQFLVGFDEVVRAEGDLPWSPLGTHTMAFLNADNWGGLLLSGRKTDMRFPAVANIESRTYQDALFQGIPYKRLATSSSGWVSADGTKRAVDVTTVDSYTADFCPSQITTVTNHGTLVSQTTRATPANLAHHQHCLESGIVEIGTHANPALDFRKEQRIARAANGVITEAAVLGSSGPLVEQAIEYDGDFDPIAIHVAGKGTTHIAYDPVTKLPVKVITPDGVVTQVVRRHPTMDVIEDVLMDRGSTKWNDYATYDGQERLATHWSSVDGSSAAAPRQRYTYEYASTNRPASVSIHTLVDAETGVYRDQTELYTAAEEKIGSAQLHDSGWVFDGFIARSRAHARRDRFQIKTQPASSRPATLDYAALLEPGAEGIPSRIESVTGSTLEREVATSTRLHADVTKATTTSLEITLTGELARTTLVNGSNATTALLDAAGKLQTGYIDETLTAYAYDYDAMGRLRLVTLPDGAHHDVSYDEYGRVSRIARDGIANITNTYTQVAGGTTDLPASRTFASAPAAPAAPVPQRSTTWSYDAAGRKLAETHTDLTSSAAKTFSFFYDGATPTTPVTESTRQSGLLTGVRGEGYTKTFAYRPDGPPTRKEVALAGFRTVVTDFTYRQDGGTRDQIVTVKDASGNVVQTSAHHEDVDVWGRPSVHKVNGAVLASTGYDALGRTSTVSFATGDSASFAYDPLTRALTGFDQVRAGQAWSGVASTRLKLNDRGFIGQETLGVGPSRVSRAYSYSPQGFLTLAVDGSNP